MDKFLERHKLLKYSKEKNLNRPIIRDWIGNQKFSHKEKPTNRWFQW